jgi:hypothetical protein
VTNPAPQVRRFVPGGISRSGAMVLGAAPLACGAVLIAVDKRDLLDLSSVGHAVLAWSGHALAFAGAVYLALIWWTERFRLSIGRVMAIIAMLAVLLAVIVHLLRTGQRTGPGASPRGSPTGGRGQVFVPRSGSPA